MRASDVRVGQGEVIELRPVGREDFGATFVKQTEVLLHWTDTADEVLLHDGQQTWSVSGADQRNNEGLRDLVANNLPRLCHVAAIDPRRGPTHRLIIEIRSFPAKYPQEDEMRIGVSDAVIEEMISKHFVPPRAKTRVDEALGWLVENSIIKGSLSQSDRLLVSGGRLSDADTRSQFRIYGKAIAVDLRRNDANAWDVVRVVKGGRPSNEDERPVFILEGHFTYVDISVAAQIRVTAPTILDSLVKQSSSYLALWEHYNELEKRIIIQRAREFGWLRYSSRTPLPDGQWRFIIRMDERSGRVLSRLEEAEEADLEAGRRLPDELQDEPDAATQTEPIGSATGERTFAGQCVRVDINRGTVDLRPIDVDRPDQPPEPGVIYVALRGDRTRLARRRYAHQRLQQFTGPMPQLGLILEKQTFASAPRKANRIRRKVVAELIGGDPTPRQMRALEAALHTPDIALIQGPPGTGKTRVIAALQALLADEKSRETGGRILLTSYQHDAVDTAASKTSVMGLPPIRVGGRRGVLTLDTADAWRRECSRRIRSRLENSPQLPIGMALRSVRDLVRAYIARPGRSVEAVKLLDTVFDLSGVYLSPELGDELLQLIQHSHRTRVDHLPADYEERSLLLAAIRGLRTEPTSFGDDGPISAYKLLRRLEEHSDLVTDGERAVLDRAADGIDQPSAELLTGLQILQDKLLDRLSDTETVEQNPLINADIERILTRTESELHARAVTSYEGVDEVLYEYAKDLENDPNGVRAAVEAYSSVFAATCQQSAGLAMQKLKGEEDFNFDTVIVDEAARANPLDLFVPMVRASRRIILVGDHRQLPQILEPDVERQLELSRTETREALSESLFQRLFLQLSELQKRGAVVRAVTLDTQYRMHRILGDLVSNVFYEPYGEGFKSVRPDEDFAHSIPRYTGKVAAWIDLPMIIERERGGQSKSRRAEAEWAVREAKRILELCPHFSVGIITFYSAQEKEIQRYLLKLGLAEDVDGRFEIARKWGFGEDDQGRYFEKLRVGTVDSFQGKEFDVVILSMTRSNDLPSRDAIEARRKYGFLTLENRLCVAMSRQKRLLIVVGDAAMVTDESAKMAVPGLRAFYDLCGGEYGIRLSV